MRNLFAASCLLLALAAPSVAAEVSTWRALHLIGYHDDDALEKVGRQVPPLAAMGVNVIILEVDYNFAFQSHPDLQNEKEAITAEGARKLAAVCRANKVRLIPQFQCLGHQSWGSKNAPLLAKHPEFDLTPGAFPENKGIYCREWNPLDPRVNKIVFALMDELIDAFQADAFHVGMDEVFLLGSKESPATRDQDPAKLFAQAVTDCHTHLTKERHVQMLMWADRLIDGKPLKLTEWESSHCGTAAAVDLVPKDIILCPWHYSKRKAYPSIPLLLDKGFRVLPASYKDVAATTALIEYGRAQHNPLLIGHMFTTWGAAGRDRLPEYPALKDGLQLLKATPSSKPEK